MVKIHLLIGFLFSGRHTLFRPYNRWGDFTGEMKLSSFQWIRHCVTKNNADVQQNYVQPASARAGRPGKKPLRRAGEEGTTNPTSSLNPQLALLCAHQWVEMLFPKCYFAFIKRPSLSNT